MRRTYDLHGDIRASAERKSPDDIAFPNGHVSDLVVPKPLMRQKWVEGAALSQDNEFHILLMLPIVSAIEHSNTTPLYEPRSHRDLQAIPKSSSLLHIEFHICLMTIRRLTTTKLDAWSDRNGEEPWVCDER